MSFVEKLREAAASVQRPRHPWEDRLRGLRGTTGYDGVERVTTQAVLDRLEIPQRARNPATYLELARSHARARMEPDPRPGSDAGRLQGAGSGLCANALNLVLECAPSVDMFRRPIDHLPGVLESVDSH